MSKKIISLFLALSFIFVSCQLTFAEGETEYDISAGSQTIETGGNYKITGTTTTNTLVIGKRNDDGSFENITVNLTLDNVNMSSESAHLIHIYPNAKVNLTLVGNNTLTCTGSKKTALLVDASAGILSKLTIIKGNGALTVSSGENAAAIGSSSTSSSGEIVINGGRIVATGGNGAAAIGSGYNKTNGPITINGGYIKVTGTRGIGSGSGKATNTWGDIAVNGGSIIEENVTDTWTSLNYQPKNSEGENVSKITLTMPNASSDANKEFTINGWSTVTDDSAKIYPYVTEDTTSIAAKSGNGEIYYCKNMNISTTKSYNLTKYTGDPCSCTAGTAAISLDKIESSAAVNVIEKRKEIELKGEFIPSLACAFPIHSAPADITYSIAEKNNAGADMSGVAEVSGNVLTVYSGAVGKTLVLTAVTENNSISYTASKEINVTQDETVRFDISENNIIITNKDSDNLNVQVGTIDFTVPKDKEITIYQKSASTSNYITVSANATINLDNVNIEPAGVNNAIKVGGGVTLNLKLSGNNTLKNAIIGENNSSINISGNGALNVKGSGTAAIGKFGNVVIDSGTIKAEGGNNCAGIGGNANSPGSNVTINGGKITAIGGGYAAGIGGGNTGRGGTVIINGGMVEASSNNGSCGIGGGSVAAIDHGAITINGGSVNATVGADISQYMCTLSGLAANRDVEYTIGNSTETIKTSTDSSGLLYFYLPEGENKIKVICDGKTYYERLDIDAAKTNEGVLSTEITADITSLKILNRPAEINQESGEISITLPNNLDLTNVEADIESNGYKVEVIEGSIQGLFVKYKVLGDDGVTEKTYNLTITLKEPGNDKDILDISKGSIYISKSGVQVITEEEETNLTPNPNGYIITGTSDIYTLVIEEDTDVDLVFQNLRIKSTSDALPAVEIYGLVINIILEGDNVIESVQTEAITSDGVGDVNISGTGNLTVKGGTGAPALDVNNSSLSITSSADTAESGKIILEGGSNSKAVENGVVVTNSTTNLKIIDHGSSKTSVADASSTPLNAVKVILPVENANGLKCTYSSKSFTLDADSAFYLMLPDGEHIISVTYNNGTYLGRVTVNGEAVSVTLEGEKITGVTLDSSSTITYEGGETTFVVDGIIDPDKTKIQFVPNNSGFAPLTENVTFDSANNRNIVTVTLPENKSGTDEVKYTIKGYINNKVVYTAENAVTLPINDTYCNIKEFTIEGGTTENINNNNRRINVTFPFDHTLVGHYEVSIEHEGSKVTSQHNSGPSTYYFGAFESYVAAASFMVTAKNGKTTKTYTAILDNESEPTILNVTVDTSSLTNKGGKLNVEIEGSSLGNVVKAEKAENRVVTVSVGGKSFTATPEMRNKIWYVAEIEIDPNTETTEKTLDVVVQVGSEGLGISKTVQIKQPKGDSNNTNIKSISIANQVTGAWTTVDKYAIIMPFDANLASLTPNIVLEDKNASYTPKGAQNFASGDVTYTVTAQNGTTAPYTLSVTKQAEPVATGVSFTAPTTSEVDSLDFTVDGDNLENIEPAISKGKIVVKCTPEGGGTAITGTAALKGNKYVASITGLSNSDTEANKVYTVSVEINNKPQTLTGGNPTLTIPRKPSDSCDIKGFKLIIDGQTDLAIGENTITLKVPYNTDLRSLTPQITLEDTRGSYSDANVNKNFEKDVTYTVTSESGKTKTYTVTVSRAGQAGVTSAEIEQPLSNKPGNVVITLTGNFIKDLGDEITVTATPEGGTAIPADIIYTGYSGKATATLPLPDNEDETEKTYIVSVMLKGTEQTISNNEIVVPAKKPCSIISFKVGNVVARPDSNNKITLKVPYETDLKKITPTVTIAGDHYEPIGERDFTNTVNYTVYEGDDTKTYEVTITRDGKPSINKVTIKNPPTTNKGGQVTVELEGVFWSSAKVKVIAPDNTPEDTDMTINDMGKASAVVSVGENSSPTEAAEYTLEFYLDDFDEKAEYEDVKITVPAKKPCSISSFKVGDAVATPEDDKIMLKVPYETDLKKITPIVTFEGDSCEPASETEQDFTNPVTYTVTQGDDTKTYEVTITRDGEPSINKVTIKNAPTTNKGGQVTVELEGVFWTSAKVRVIAPDNTSEEFTVPVNEMGKASAVVSVGENSSPTEAAEYTLEFYLDDFDEKAEYEDVKITVPARKPCSILSFKVGDAVATPDAENKITLKVPYETDLKKITPIVTFEGDSCEPASEMEQDFTNPVTYTVTEGDDTKTYEVTITRDGKPSINKVTIKNAPTTNKGGQVTVELEGVFWNSAKVRVIAPDDTSKDIDMTVNESGKASAVVSVGENSSLTDAAEYTLEFYLDDFDEKAEYEDVKITVPFRKSSTNMENSSSRVTPKTKPTPTPLPEQTAQPSDNQTTPEPTQTPDNTPKTMPYIRGYEEFGQKLFKPNNTITRAEVAAIMSVLDADFDENAQYSNSFSDVANNAWYSNYISYAAEKGYIQGYDDGTSRPEKNITRAEFVSIIARYINAETYTGISLFRDIDNIEWCRNQINSLAQLGIVNGYDDAMFMPNKLLTRAEAVVMINRAINRVMTEEIKSKLNNPFDDVNSGHWAYGDILLASCEY